MYLAIAEDHKLVRTGIVNLLQLLGDFHFIIEADNGLELLHKISNADIQPDICILDINMPIMNGYETLIKLRGQYPYIKSLTLTHEETDYNIIKMFQAGTNGYLFKSASHDEFRQALLDIYSTGFYYSNGVKERFPDILDDNLAFQSKKLLRPQEESFLRYCCSLLTYREIGERLNLSEKTIQHWAERISENLGIKNHRIALAMYAVRVGLGSFDDSSLKNR